MRPPVVSIVGKSGAGKTSLIEKLMPALKARGLRVATLKHDAHRFEIDHEGKDTYRHFQAGSDAVVIASSEKLAMVRRLQGAMTLDAIIESYLTDVDLVLTEGYKSGNKPKIEVHRKAISQELLCGPGDNLVAVVTDDDIKVDCPVFKWADIESLADFIQKMPEHKTGLTGLILAGGKSSRMGRDKATMEYKGLPLIRHVLAAIEPVCDPVLIIGGNIHYESLDIPVVPDIAPGGGAIMGIYTGLLESPNESALVVGCDMPFIKTALVKRLAEFAPRFDVVVPRIGGHLEPLLAIYSKRCIPEIDRMIRRGEKRILDFFPGVKVKELTEDDLRPFDPDLSSFLNLNTPEDLKIIGTN